MGKIEINNVDKTYENGIEVFNNLNLTIEDQSFTVILGPSGCGKSTLLRMIAGLEDVSSGQLFIDDVDITHQPPEDRDIAMVFQNYALYPHMTVYENVDYSLKINKVDKKEREERVMNALSLVQIDHLKERKPAHLSGGQQQRVALARAIVKEPSVFLMDEPLSNLDAKLRNEMRDVISLLHQKLNTTFVYVTHDQSEAMSLANDIILLHHGKIMQHGSPKDLYTNPENIFTAEFIGDPPFNTIETENGYIAFRPEDSKIIKNKNQKDFNNGLYLDTNIKTSNYVGSDTIYHLDTKYDEILIKTENTWEKNPDIEGIFIEEKDILNFDKNGERIK